MAGELNEKQKRFAAEYLVDLNATQAALRAGYAEKSAGQQACDLLKNPKIQSLIQEGRKRIQEATAVTTERVIQEYAKVAFANMADYIAVQSDGTAKIRLTDLTRDQAAAISEIYTEEVVEGPADDPTTVRKTKLRFHNKLGALDSLAKHLGMFIDKVELGGKNGEALIVTVMLPDNGRSSK